MRSVVRSLAELGDDLVLAPERHLAVEGETGEGIPIGELVSERTERIDVSRIGRDAVIDTTHARDGVLDLASARLLSSPPKSSKKRAHRGDLLVSRLRPYLRQIALAPERLAVSTEFYVLAPRSPADDLAFLVPFLLSPGVQATLASAQEGGHHPRVPRASLLAIRVPVAAVRARRRTSASVRAALDALYRAEVAYREVLARS